LTLKHFLKFDLLLMQNYIEKNT